MDLSVVEMHVVEPVVDAGGFAEVSLRVKVELDGGAVLSDAGAVSAFLSREPRLDAPSLQVQRAFERFTPVGGHAS